MAEEQVDSLVIGSRFDDAGLRESEQAQLDAIRDFARQVGVANQSIAPLTVDTSRIATALRATGQEVDRLFGSFDATTANQILNGIVEELAVTGASFKANTEEARALQAEITRLRTLQGLELAPGGGAAPTGRSVQTVPPEAARFARALAEENRDLAASATAATGALEAEAAAALATGRAQAQAAALVSVARPAVAVAPIRPPEPPDFSETVIEAIRAADTVRREFDQAISGQRLGSEWSRAARQGADQLVAGFLTKLGGLSESVAAQILDPADAVRQVDLALEAMSQEITSRQAAIPEVVLRARGTGPTDQGVITEEEFQAAERFASAETDVATAADLAAKALQAQALAAQAAANAQARAAAAGAGTGAAAAAGAAAAETVRLANAEALAQGAALKAAAGFAEAARQARVLAAAEAQAATGAGRMAAGLAQAAEQRAAMDAVAGSVAGIPSATQRAATGTRTLAVTMASLGAQSLGVRGMIGSLATQFLLFGAGGPIALGVAGFAAVVAIAYELITKKAHEARKATEDFIDAQAKQARARDAVGTVQEAFGGVSEAGGRQIEGITARLARLNEKLADAKRGVEVFDRATGGIKFVVDDSAVAKLQQDINDLVLAAGEVGRNFLEPILRAQLTAARQGINDELAVRKAGLAAAEADARASFGRQEITAQEFAARRLANAKASTAAEVAALAAERDRVAGSVAVKPEEKVARAAEVAHLNEMIRLRLLEGKAQEAAIANELRQNQALIEREDHLRRVAQLGGGNLTPGAGGTPGGNIPTQAGELSPSDFGVRNQGISLEIPVILRGALDRETLDSGKILAANFENAKNKANALASGLLGVARGLANIAGQAGAAVGGVLDLVGALQEVKLANQQAREAVTDVEKANAALAKMSATLGLVGQAAGFLGSFVAGLTGPSRAEQERDNLLRENSRALSALKASMDQQLQGGNAIAAAAQAALSLANNPNVEDPLTKALVARPGFEEVNKRALERAVADAGLSIEDFARIVKQQTGLDILDSKGRLVAGTLDQVRDGFEVVIRQMSTFGTSFDEELQRRNLGSRLAGEPQDAAANFARERDAFIAAVGDGASAFKDQLGNLDFGDEASVRAALLNLFNRIQAGGLTAEDLGGLSKEDWLKFLEDGATFLDSFNQGLADATKRVGDFNLPEGFKRASLAFANAAVGPFVPPPTISPIPPSINVHPIGGDGAELPQLLLKALSATGAGAARGAVDITVNVRVDGAGSDTQTIRADVTDGLREGLHQLGLLRDGDTLSVGGV